VGRVKRTFLELPQQCEVMEQKLLHMRTILFETRNIELETIFVSFAYEWLLVRTQHLMAGEPDNSIGLDADGEKCASEIQVDIDDALDHSDPDPRENQQLSIVLRAQRLRRSDGALPTRRKTTNPVMN
jgi:hypothetical protein